MNLKNKVVLITGSSSGIGKAVALRFAEEGAKVIINYNVNKTGAEETLAEIEKLGVEGSLVQADVSKPDESAKLIETSVKMFGGIDVLINNAGIGTDKVPFMDASYEDILELINTNLIGPMICSQLAVKVMQKQGSGKIINTSSIRGAEHGGRAIVYAATKAAINSLTKTLAKEVAPDIQVNAVAPGFVKTRNYDNMSEEKINTYLNQTYLKRWITKEEIADAFIFLAKNDGITGQVIYVDGGFTLK